MKTSHAIPTNRFLVNAAGTLLASFALAACGGASGGGGSSSMFIAEVNNGFGVMLPYRTFKLENGQPTSTVIAIRSQQDIANNVSAANPILPMPTWPTAAVLPTGEPGNHYIVARFSAAIDPLSVLDPTQGGAVSNGLTGSITIVSIDPASGATSPVSGRGFIGGKTFSGTPDFLTGQLPFTSWVTLGSGTDGQPKPVAAIPEAFGFPGTQQSTGFAGAPELLGSNVFVFVIDNDANLLTHNTFPAGRQIRMRVSSGVRSTSGAPITEVGLASSTVGDDTVTPEVIVNATGSANLPQIVPGNGASNVDPSSTVRIAFTEPVQPFSLGTLDNGTPPLISSAVQMTFGPAEGVTNVPFVVRPVSIYDLSVMELIPAFPFPGAGPPSASCDTFSVVQVQVTPDQVRDLSPAANRNTEVAVTDFEVGQGIGLVNAPVAPDVIYAGRAGSEPGISVIDLNGFGQSTGNPAFDPFNPIVKGNSNFPNNPNVALQGPQLLPALKLGTCTVDGGSAGVFTLTKDSALNDKLIRAPLIDSVGDMALGQALDVAFNNSLPPFGCQSGNPNLCASTGKKRPTPVLQGSGSVVAPSAPGQFGSAPPGSGNLISWAPHPNPPPLVFPPLCVSPNIGGLEPTSVDTLAQNLLQTGNPFGNPGLNQPPTGLLAIQQNSFFVGPSTPKDLLTACTDYQIRQQIGHFMYVVDRLRRQVVVLNSNRFFVLERINLPDPTSLAVSPNVDFLAVTNQGAGTVSFIDIRPGSSTFHQVVSTTKVGTGPRGIAWQSGNEDIFVCNESDSTVSILRALDFQVRKTLKAGLQAPFEVVLLPRQASHGFNRNVYFGFILGRNGRVSIFESGPNGANGWGFDDIVSTLPFTFANPKAMAPDYTTLNGAIWVVHENPLNPTTGLATGVSGGAVSNVFLESGTFGQLPLVGGGGNPQVRDIEFVVRSSIGPETLTGIPVDIAFDNLANAGGLPNSFTTFSAGVPAPVNGKGLIRGGGFGFGGIIPTSQPSYMFLAVPNSNQGGGVVDVINLDAGLSRVDTDVFLPGVQSIPAAGVNVLMDYFRQ